MSRGGRGGARGGARKGQPDFAWDDEEVPAGPVANRPPPTFPRVDLHIPRPLDKKETASVDRYLSFRNRTRSSPYFATLDPSSLTDDKGKVDKRAGFDPFNDQDAYSKKFENKKRTVPELGGNDYALQFFPKELWPLLDPRRKNPLWKTIEDKDALKTRKRKRKAVEPTDEQQREHDSDEDSDVIATGRRQLNAAKSQKKDPTSKQANQKRGLDAEDDYPDDQNDDDNGDDNDEPEDSEFEEDDEDGDDYNAEQYFEDGEGDDYGDDGGGEGGEEGYY